MNIFGIGGMELVFILIIMLVVAGPKRMLRWAYVLGIYMSKLRKMWEETVGYLQKEFDDAGVDVKLPKEMPTRANLTRTFNQAATNAMKPVTAPVKETLNEVDRVKRMATTGENGRPAEAPASPPPASPPNNLGSWSGSSEGSDEGSAS